MDAKCVPLSEYAFGVLCFAGESRMSCLQSTGMRFFYGNACYLGASV